MSTPDRRRRGPRTAALLLALGAVASAPLSAAATQDGLAGAGFSVASCLATEAASGTTACHFVVTLPAPSAGPLTVTYQTGSSDNLLGPNAQASLEDPVVGSESMIFGAGSQLGAWLVESGNVELKSFMNWQPAHYRQSLDMHGDTAGAIGRDIATQPGQAYTVSFARAAHPVCVNTATTMTASFGNASLGSFAFDSTGRTLQDMGWRYEAITVTANAATTRVRFASTTPGGCGPALDDVAVSPAGVASSGIDFVPAWRHPDDPLVLPAGTTTHTLTVNVLGDANTEGYEDFELQVCIAGLGCETAIGGIDESTQGRLFADGFEGG